MLRQKALDETSCKAGTSLAEKLPEALQLALDAAGRTHQLEPLHQTSPHAKLVATSQDLYALYMPHMGPFIHVASFDPQVLQTSDRCTGETYAVMLDRMDEEPSGRTVGFWRRLVSIMADRDGTVMRGVNSKHKVGPDSVDETTCQMHAVHDVATYGTGIHLKEHMKALIHVQRSLQSALDCREFRMILRRLYDEGLRIRHGRCPPYVQQHRIGVLDTFMPLGVDGDMYLEERLVLERYANGDWLREDDTYDLYIDGDCDELQLRVEAVEKVPRALALNFRAIVESRWKGIFSNLGRIGVGWCFNKLYPRAYREWVTYHNDVPPALTLPQLLMIADGVAPVTDADVAGGIAGDPALAPAAMPTAATVMKAAMSNHRKVGYALCCDEMAGAFLVVQGKCNRYQQALADACIDLSKADYVRMEYARAALASEDGETYIPRGRVYVVASHEHVIKYRNAMHRLLQDPDQWYALAPEHRTRDLAALIYKCAASGLGVMRQKVWATSRKHPYTMYRRAMDAMLSGQWDDFKTSMEEDPPCMRDPSAEDHCDAYIGELDTELCVTDAAYRVLVALADNILKELNHARNRRYVESRTVHACDYRTTSPECNSVMCLITYTLALATSPNHGVLFCSRTLHTSPCTIVRCALLTLPILFLSPGSKHMS
jgi:DNA-binding transcriptional regulator of glucitol operon